MEVAAGVDLEVVMKNISMKSALVATALTLSNITLFMPYAALAADATVHVAGRPAFDVLAAAGGYSAISRAEIMQKNLDNALIASVNAGSAPAVNVSYQKGVPVVTVAGHYIGTVDNASAKAAKTTPALLANRWAGTLRNLLGDSESIDAYVAQLTGGDRTQAAVADGGFNNVQSTPVQPAIVNLPAGLNFPISLTTSISSETARNGDVVMARLDEPINLGSAVIPAGTVVSGKVVTSEPGKRLLARSGALEVAFNSMQLPNGQSFPIYATISGGVTEAQQRSLLGKVAANPFGRTAIEGTAGAGLGAALGTAIGAIAGSHGTRGRAIGRGAWSGAAIGGGVGALHALFLAKGTNVVYPSGQHFTLQLQSPAQVALNGNTTGLF